ncbi:hypothetical protein CDAR_518571 [Caerostris darwini]|uniref:Uncharacterized protein n=1 Tax=Caerostris darwini TaxID=1538125 RepID=A0AAV4UVV2_9ARAC|nr:hypothetical protein CDAR_518571 [Caerostris darwini]
MSYSLRFLHVPRTDLPDALFRAITPFLSPETIPAELSPRPVRIERPKERDQCAKGPSISPCHLQPPTMHFRPRTSAHLLSKELMTRPLALKATISSFNR